MAGSTFTIQSFKAGRPPIICAPSVRPWKAPSKLTMPIFLSPPTLRPYVRISLRAHSVVSEPVVSRNALSRPSGASSTSLAARSARMALGKQ